MGALDDLKILDFSTLLPGPLGTMLLADMGADVVSVIGPGKHDLMNDYPPFLERGSSASGAWLGRNKRSIFLNLKKPEGVQAVKEMVKEYDIVIEQFRPGVMDRLGVGYEALREVNPKIIYCSISGYGQNGPMAQKVGHDINYIAQSGNIELMMPDGSRRVVMPNFQLGDVAGGGYMAPIAILSAVHHRDVTGQGQYIDLSLMDAILPFGCCEAVGALAAADGVTDWKPCTISGVVQGPHYDIYETADGKFMSVGALEPKFYANLVTTLGKPEWAEMRYLFKNMDEVRQFFTETFKSKTRDEWAEIFSTVEACVEPVYDMTEMIESPQVQAREMTPAVPVAGKPGQTIRQIGNPIKFSETPVEYRHTAYPAGHHTAEVLGGLGFSEKQIKTVSTN